VAKPKVIAVVGPTASGKSSLGIFLAQKLGGTPRGKMGEVVSADSRQVYRGLDIGTGKVTKKEMDGVPHHLLDVASPKKQFSASDFVKKASEAVISIYGNDGIPIVVGGTGFYVDALLGRIMLPDVPPNKKLREQLERHTTERLYAMLKKKDPMRAKTIEPAHKRRLVRALEVAEFRRRQTTHTRALRGASPGPTLALNSLETPEYRVLWLGLNPGELKLKKNIHARLLARMRSGMVLEAKRLHTQGLSYKRMEELGLEYRSLAKFLQKKISKKELEEEIERGSWLYAKRQMRWFLRNPDIHWVKNKAEALRLAKQFLSR